MGQIYLITNTKNRRKYVGSTVNYVRRWRGHLSDLKYKKHHSRFLQRDYNKCGVEAFEFVVIEDNVPEDLLDEREQFWIRTLKPEYNCKRIRTRIPSGSGKGSYVKTEEHKRKISEALKGRKYPKERVEKSKAAAKAAGWSPSPEHRKKLSEANKGQKRTVGRKHTEETKAKMRAAHAARRAK